jgi:predicted transcriptional regulator of viral defense system
MPTATTQSSEDGPGALEWLRSRQTRGRYTFTHAEAVEALRRTPLAVSKALRRLVGQGLLASPRRGFYVIVPGEFDLAGAPPAQWFIHNLMGYLEQPYYVGLLTAAAQHGASHQAAQVFQVVTDRPTRPMEAGRIRIEFVMKSDIEGTPTAEVKTPTGYMTVSTPEATALDLVRYFKAAGHLGHVATVLEELAERLDGDEMVPAARVGGYETAVVQRLGYVLDRVGAESVTAGLAAIVAEKAPQAVPLRPDRPRRRCPVDARWRVAVNDEAESDL